MSVFLCIVESKKVSMNIRPTIIGAVIGDMLGSLYSSKDAANIDFRNIDTNIAHSIDTLSLQIEDPEKQTFVIAPLPEMIIPKGMASESLLADILIDKYVYHLPFYRVIQKYKELGVLLSDSTIGDWFNAVCSKLRPLYDKLRERIMSSDYIPVDESTLPVIDNEKHRAVKGYIWAVRDAVCGDVYFHYDMGSRAVTPRGNLSAAIVEPSRQTATRSMKHMKAHQASE